MHIKSGMIKFNVCKWKKKKEKGSDLDLYRHSGLRTIG